MKKLFAIILSSMIALSFLGCQNNNPAKSDASEKSVAAGSGESSVESSGESSVQSTAKSSEENPEAKGIYKFTDYESKDVFNIEKVDIDSNRSESFIEELNARVVTYEFYYLSGEYTIKAYVSMPYSCIKTQKPAKCLLYNRGGHWNYGSLSSETLAYTAAVTNRVVVGCEIRGDNGSGGYEQFGGVELNDVYKLIDLCDKRFSFIDMDDFCVMGISRGGMTTYMTARHDKRVKRIIVISGLADLESAYEERKDMQGVLINCIGGSPEQKPEEYKKRSAVNWADEIRIPVLIIHSKGDPKAKYETQGKAMYDKLKDKTECIFISREGDYHGVETSAGARDIPEINKFLGIKVVE